MTATTMLGLAIIVLIVILLRLDGEIARTRARMRQIEDVLVAMARAR